MSGKTHLIRKTIALPDTEKLNRAQRRALRYGHDLQAERGTRFQRIERLDDCDRNRR